MHSNCSDPFSSTATEMQARTFIVYHKIGLGLSWLHEELAAFLQRAVVIRLSVAAARKDAHCVVAAVPATERRN